MRTLIVSDLHLGSPSSRASAALAALGRFCRDYDRVIVNGDALDRYEKPACSPRAERLLEQVRTALTPARGTLTLLTGNHDPAVSDEHWLYIKDAQALVFHGDCIRDVTHPTKHSDQMLARHLASVWAARGGRPERFLDLVELYRTEQRRFAEGYPYSAKGDPVWRYFAKVLFPPQRPFHVLQYWAASPGWVAKLAATFDRPVRTAIVGHSHRAGRWVRHGLEVLNTGSFMPFSRAQAVSIEGPQIRAVPLDGSQSVLS